MDIRLTGTGGPGGWPEPGCRCAPCARARRLGVRRRPSAVLLDGTVQLGPEAGDPAPGSGDSGAGAGYRVERLPGGWDVTTPDGGRLLLAEGPGAVPEPAGGAAPYHAALLDLGGDPAQLGLLRRRGLVTDETVVAPVHIDHRVRSEEELARRCALWRVQVLDDGSHVTVAPGTPAVSKYSPTRGRLTTERRAGEPWRVLLLGGARSGKSAEAELRLAAEPEVTYVATGPGPGTDRDWAARVAAHRSRRPRWWRTAETLDLAGQLRAASGALLVDGIGTWLAGTMGECGIWAALEAGAEGASAAGPEGASAAGLAGAAAAGPGGASAADPAGAEAGSEVAGASPEAAVPGPPGDDAAEGGRAQGTEAAATGRLAGRVAELLDAWRHTQAHVVAVSDEAGSGVVPATASGRRFRDELGHLNQLLAAQSDETALVVAGRVLPLPV